MITSSPAEVMRLPAIRFNFLADPIDQRAMVDGFRMMRRIVEAKPMDRFRGDEYSPGKDVASDEQILARIQSRFPNDILLVPPADGFNTLVWALPAAVTILAGAGLIVAFRRWRHGLASAGPTEEDRALVTSALAASGRDEP